MERMSGNIFIRQNGEVLAKGDRIEQHEHDYDHTGFLFTGAVHLKKIRPDGSVMERDFHAPDHFLIRAEERHEFTALADNTVLWCVYSHRFPQGLKEGVETVKDSGWDDPSYEALNKRDDDVIERPMGYTAAYS